MGRKRKYTKDELKKIKRKWKLDWYYRNREKVNEKRMKKYYENNKRIFN
jgi:hypothetical protein